MSYKWILLLAAVVAALPIYLFWQGDGVEAAIIGIPLFLIGAALLGCMSVLHAK
jgi:hypothetical protein